MKKALLFAGVFCGLLAILFLAGRATNSFLQFKVSSKANEPTLKLNEKFYASNLKKPLLFDFICYHTEEEHIGEYIAVHRVCGMPGNIVQIKKGNLYINNKPVDQNLPLRHEYKISMTDFEKLINTSDRDAYKEGDSMVLYLDDNTVRANKIQATRKIIPPSLSDPFIVEKFFKDWNRDNFGPIEVPANCFFVMGDNRLESLDSRYKGFVQKDKMVATVVWE